MTEDWDISSGAMKFGLSDLDTWWGPIAGWPDDKCKTGFQSQMLYIDDEGYAKNFTKKTIYMMPASVSAFEAPRIVVCPRARTGGREGGTRRARLVWRW